MIEISLFGVLAGTLVSSLSLVFLLVAPGVRTLAWSNERSAASARQSPISQLALAPS